MILTKFYIIDISLSTLSNMWICKWHVYNLTTINKVIPDIHWRLVWHLPVHTMLNPPLLCSLNILYHVTTIYFLKAAEDNTMSCNYVFTGQPLVTEGYQCCMLPLARGQEKNCYSHSSDTHKNIINSALGLGGTRQDAITAFTSHGWVVSEHVHTAWLNGFTKCTCVT